MNEALFIFGAIAIVIFGGVRGLSLTGGNWARDIWWRNALIVYGTLVSIALSLFGLYAIGLYLWP